MNSGSSDRKDKLEELRDELEELKRDLTSPADPTIARRLQNAIKLVNELAKDEQETSRISGGYVISPRPEVVPPGRRWQ